MLRKFTAGLLTIIMLVTFISISLPTGVAYAFENFKVEVIKSKAPIREGYYESKDVKKWVTKGTTLTIVGDKTNLWGNLWYKVKGGGYIYSGNVEKLHDHKIVITGYETAHPHYAIHKCKYCDDGATCGPETKKVKGCEKCYPSSQESKKENTNKVPNTNVTTPADILVPKQPSLQEEIEKKQGTTETHKHNYKLSHYSSTHPHYAIYKCSCSDSYTEKSKTEKQSGCTTCYPPHKHEYNLVGYSDTHPHIAVYKCSCKEQYSDSSVTTKVKDCKQCYPYGYGNDHFCQFVCTNRYLNEHPHYTIAECTVCGKEEIDYKETHYSSKCNICNSSFKNNMDTIPDFHGRIYDLSTGGIIYTPKKVTVDELYDFAEELHLTLDALGLFPVVGEVFDGINVAYYIVEGNFIDAALSGASMIPIVGTVSTTGKIAKKAGYLTIDASTRTVKKASLNLTKEIVEEGIEKNVSEAGLKILNVTKKYPEETLKTIKKITFNSSIRLDELYYNGSLLISRGYKGTVISPAGIKYTAGSSQGHRIYHVLERHGLSQKGITGHGTLFNVDNMELFETIDDIYSSGNLLDIVEKTDGRVYHYYEAGKTIGLNGETKLKMIFEGDTLITAYPVKKITD